jgi:hypothetical protein
VWDAVCLFLWLVFCYFVPHHPCLFLKDKENIRWEGNPILTARTDGLNRTNIPKYDRWYPSSYLTWLDEMGEANNVSTSGLESKTPMHPKCTWAEKCSIFLGLKALLIFVSEYFFFNPSDSILSLSHFVCQSSVDSTIHIFRKVGARKRSPGTWRFSIPAIRESYKITL